MSASHARRDDWRRTRSGRMGLDGDALMGPDWFQQQADLAVEETDLWPEETVKNQRDIESRDRLLVYGSIALVVTATLMGAVCILAAIWSK